MAMNHASHRDRIVVFVDKIVVATGCVMWQNWKAASPVGPDSSIGFFVKSDFLLRYDELK